MGVAKKGQRKLVRNNRVFYWCVRYDSDDDNELYLVIKSDDKKFIVSYMLKQKSEKNIYHPENPFIVVKGKEFKGLGNLGHCWERFIVPDWEDDIITPSLVAKIIDWCFTNEDVVPVDWRGKVLANRLDYR